MRLGVLSALVLSILAAPGAMAGQRCGDAPEDAAALAAAELEATTACPCCDVARAARGRRCVVVLVKEVMAEGRLPRRCVRQTVREVVRGCRLHASECGGGPSTTTTTTTLPPSPCAVDADCDDGNGCSVDRCTEGTCVHECVCVGPGSVGITCCPGPAAECAPPPTTSTTLPKPCEAGQCRYYETCGYPVCGGPFDGPIAGVDSCTTQKAGAACTMRFETCDPGIGCGVRLVCTDRDPTAQGCPISRREAKRDVSYLAERDLDRMLDEIRRVRLATYHYKGEPDAAPNHLGFIIDDIGASPAVAADGGHVDLYGYTSMAVAAIQAQQKRIETLEHEVATLRRELARRR